jgi:signal transduction histidine kinase
MKEIIKLILLLCLRELAIMLLIMLPYLSLGQQRYAFYHVPVKKDYDIAQAALKTNLSDTARMAAYHESGFYFAGSNLDSCLYFFEQELVLARKLGLKLWEADALDFTGFVKWRLGNYPGALQDFLTGIEIAQDPASEGARWSLARFDTNKNPRIVRLILLAQFHFDLSTLYEETTDSVKEFAELTQAEKVASENHDKAALAQINTQFGSYYRSHNSIDSAIIRLQNAGDFADQSGLKFFEGERLNQMAMADLRLGDYATAQKYFRQSIAVSIELNTLFFLTETYLFLDSLFLKQGKTDSALFYAREALALIKITHGVSDAAQVYNSLSSVFQLRNNIDSAFKYQGLALAARDSLNNEIKQFQNLGFAEQFRVQQLEEEKVKFQNKIRTYAMIAGLCVILLIALIQYRNNRQKQKANVVLAKTLSDLKSTQSQLIQSEKMASLGELTAGIAHEIQNPLNFVNNFSEVNSELFDEMELEFKNGKTDDAFAIAANIRQNMDKINQHGKRADSIVKGMLLHSRVNTGQKEPTDLNAMAEEYLRITYHGMRAKDKSFNCEMKTDFASGIGKINLMPQDMGRVLLNLYNNAFYSLAEKIKKSGSEYKPIVQVRTRRVNEKIELSVHDNGLGIPAEIINKIFQPFFTTKPAGQGTGLGLSLSYDIITKEHGGTLLVQSKEGEGAEFTIQLPLN